ncbi:LytTR family DNA-binding domain-containing protein [Sphingobacterium faecium]|uniref:LytR/AlgR family response regulator transcription factor n=1 Tax=Sphingobacterium faecium TaxID=34087 RepID=UPI0021B6BF67|nr:LytTR family DNA-binding domain-containing protein [Sphingobacterium faecium]UXD67832.1 LytTR family DNA-binding domain-containing protein [Sphingobacterium faecium]
MRILIVEDETAAFETLVDILKEIDPTIQVVGNTESVSQTTKWLNENTSPDLILMDIHLSDGSSFLIFDHITVEVPIIFTTAYDEYAIEAFKVNSIDYLLKPIKSHELQRALDKFKKLSQPDILAYLSQISNLNPAKSYSERLLVPVKDKLLPIPVTEISYFYTTDKHTVIQLKDGKQYPYSKTLDQIFQMLDPNLFYRANKQFIIARHAIKDITIWFDSRLLATLNTNVPEPIYISKNKAAAFKDWMIAG